MTVDRRRILQLALGGGTLGTLSLPDQWMPPVVKSVIVPAHAQASPVVTTTTTTAAPTTTTTATTTTAAPTTTTATTPPPS